MGLRKSLGYCTLVVLDVVPKERHSLCPSCPEHLLLPLLLPSFLTSFLRPLILFHLLIPPVRILLVFAIDSAISLHHLALDPSPQSSRPQLTHAQRPPSLIIEQDSLCPRHCFFVYSTGAASSLLTFVPARSTIPLPHPTPPSLVLCSGEPCA